MKPLLALCLFASAALATPVTLVSAGKLVDSSISPYVIQIAGQDYAAMCFDLFDNVSVGETWNANLLTLADTTQLYFQSDPGFQIRYEAEIFLFNAITAPGVSAQTQTDLQYAAWGLFDVFAPVTAGSITSEESAIEAAEAGLPGLNLADYRFVESPLNVSPRAQGFVIDVGPAVVATPEVSTLASIGFGLLGIGLIRRRPRC